MKNKKNEFGVGSIIAVVLAIIAVVFVGTYAWLSWRSQNTAMVLTIGDVKGLTLSLKPYQINATLSPVTAYTDGVVVDVSASNAKASAETFDLYYAIDTIATELRNSGFKYTITRSTNGGTNYSVVKNGNFASATSGSNLSIYSDTIPASNTDYRYKVYVWIDKSSGNQASMQNKTFIAELRATIS